MLDVVNDADAVTRQALRSIVHAHGLQHRGVHVLLFNAKGKLLIQKRSLNRSQYASLWDCSVSEHVKAGESYQEAAIRGLKEELGIQGVILRPLVKFRMEYGPNDNEISTLFEAASGDFQVDFDPVEIESIQYMGMDELEILMNEKRAQFCGWFLEITNWYLKKPARLTLLQEY